MKDCVFCKISNKTEKKLCDELVNTILYEDDLIIVKPALGMSRPNYLMVFPKIHINGFAELDETSLFKVESFINKICVEYKQISGIYPIVFEHGSLPQGRHPQSITHAHLHIIPINLKSEYLKKLFGYLKLNEQSSILDLKKLKSKDYWIYRNEENKYYMSHSIDNAPRSCFIKLVAEQLGYDNSYEWRDINNNRINDVIETIETFKKLKL